MITVVVYEIRDVREADLVFLSTHLRGSDMVELVSAYGNTETPLGALQNSVRNSEYAKVITGASGDPMFLMGYCKTYSSRMKLIWAVATPEIASKEHTITFLRHSRYEIEKWFLSNPEVEYFFNLTHSQNTLHHSWLRWCKAELLPALPYGPIGQEFCPFLIRRKSYV